MMDVDKDVGTHIITKLEYNYSTCVYSSQREYQRLKWSCTYWFYNPSHRCAPLGKRPGIAGPGVSGSGSKAGLLKTDAISSPGARGGTTKRAAERTTGSRGGGPARTQWMHGPGRVMV
jgi:hypothetical protein